MLGRRWRTVTVLLLPVLLAQSSCCTILGYNIGSAIDGKEPARQSEPLTRAGRHYASLAVEVTTLDGRVVAGRREASRNLTGPELRRLYLELADRSAAAPRLPLPGDTILVSTGGRQGWARFARFVNEDPQPEAVRLDTTGVVDVVFDLADEGAPMALPWSSIDRLQWADSTRLDDPRLLLPVLATVPVDPRVFTVSMTSGAREEFRSWEVARVEKVSQRTATTIGVLTGLGTDLLLLYLFVPRFPSGG